MIYLLKPLQIPMDIKQYIESGILEEYCMGLLSNADEAFVIQLSLLYPEVKQELTEIEQVLYKLAGNNAVIPDPALKTKILSALTYSDYPLDINNLPVVDQYSDYQAWLQAVEHLIPQEPHDDFIMKVVREDDKVAQMFVVTRHDVPVETHDDRIESFFILKGECRCTVGSEIFTLTPGDFLEIPLYTEHDIKILSPKVVAILQHRAMA
jgi:mannose-6-phosphate isomerase-like protein (cupin superfamily)